MPPLLASRLDRGHEIWNSLNRRAKGAGPLLIVSGGKGDDEQVPEERFAAGYAQERIDGHLENGHPGTDGEVGNDGNAVSGE